MAQDLLTPQEFDAHIAAGTLRLSFIGMSNAGKSYRSRTLGEQEDFLWYQVDEEIRKALDLAQTSDIASWLGSPMDNGYKEREQHYLELEEEFTRRASMQTGGRNFVFDTTGSVVQLGERTLGTLKENCLVVHLEVGEDGVEELLEKFFNEPKPVAWGEYFSVAPGETQVQALRRCYPALLGERLRRYNTLAHVRTDRTILCYYYGGDTKFNNACREMAMSTSKWRAAWELRCRGHLKDGHNGEETVSADDLPGAKEAIVYKAADALGDRKTAPYIQVHDIVQVYA